MKFCRYDVIFASAVNWSHVLKWRIWTERYGKHHQAFHNQAPTTRFKVWTLNPKPWAPQNESSSIWSQKFNRKLPSTQSTNCALQFFPGSHTQSLTHMQQLLQHCKKAQLA
jgi:hypothetical protein